ncbi:immunoglobulin superfamily member 5 [Lates calcarifer]|uniref:immunoglobulin superfamily member 5 n=1 Tax=Lates calcarifer TaxID=8187 RepID=UPI000874CC17|nr:immunoglobulin superfamily member 5 [Lates calcarifer]
MTATWKSWPNLFHICLLLCATGAVSQNFLLEPRSTTVLQGSKVQFSATVEGKWNVMTWTVGKLLVLTVLSGGNITSSGQYSARFCPGGDTSCVEFTIHNVTRQQSGEVICFVQGEYGSKIAHLYVQESGTVNIVGGNVTVAQDQQVEFQCLTTGWFPEPTVSWTLSGQDVNSSLYNTTSMTDGDTFNSSSVFKFQAVHNTTVECLATVPTLPNPQSSSVLLVVVPKPTDWTVLIAVVVSFGGFALLVLLILGIIFCYKRRKEKQLNYQDEMRRVRTQSQSGVNAGGQRQGHVNAGYIPEGQTSVAPSELTDSGFCQRNGSSFEMPDVVNSSQAGNGYNSAYNTLDESGFKKHRHVTIV